MAASTISCGASVFPSGLARSRPTPRRASYMQAASRTVVTRVHKSESNTSNCRDLNFAPSASTLSAWAVLAPFALTAAAHADEATAAVTEAAGSGGFGAGEAALLLTPVGVYALFNIYREKVNPKASFLDYVYIMVFLAIVANLFSILVYKVRFF
ncbi:hypothetical protein Agub_g4080 [Astrephomene gubernaculifera]|uniref:Uncharacterized protein n=1 Tax=Astrephomene gubernaculifera TaxID=47775 RepID=A0AAD3DM22_9CHLO|nr:hypothetical protein Agub_g4080 [Astrephomene gubernaculifera]